MAGRPHMAVLAAGLEGRLASWLGARLPGVQVESAAGGADALEMLARGHHRVLVLDGKLPDAGQVLASLGNQPTSLRVIFCPEWAGSRQAAHCKEVTRVLFPPLDRERLAVEVAGALGIRIPPRGAANGTGARLSRCSAPATAIDTRLDRLLEGILSAGRRGSREAAARETAELTELLAELGFLSGSRVAARIGDLLADPGTGARAIDHLSELFLELCREVDTPVPPRRTAPQDWPRLLVIEPDPVFAADLVSEAVARGLSPSVVSSRAGLRKSFLRVRPDAMIMSLQPGRDRWSLVRDLCDARPYLPMALLAEQASLLDTREATRLGSRCLLWKPLPASFVVDEILMQMERTQDDASQVLLVHDEVGPREELATLLTSWNFQVTESESREFWDGLEETDPDLVLLWGESGLGLCRELRKDPRHVDRPVVFLTRPDGSILPPYRAGADDCLTWPVKGAELISRVSSQIHRCRARAAVSRLDPLTGLLRWPDSAMAVDQLLCLAARHQQPASLALVQPDGFEELLRSHGRLEANRRLRLLAELLHGAFRDEDVVTRWGEREFLVALYGMRRADGVRRLAETLGQFPVSAGLAEFPEDGTALQTLYLAAFDALDRARRAGGGRFVYAGWTELPASRAVDVLLLTPVGPARESLQRALQAEGYTCSMLDGSRPEVLSLPARALVMDHRPGQDCSELFQAVARRHRPSGQPILVLSGARDEELSRAAEQAGVDRVRVYRDMADLMRSLRAALGCRGAWREHPSDGPPGANGPVSRLLAAAQQRTEVAEAESARLRERDRRLASELEVARTIQDALLPRASPKTRGWSIAYRIAPARVVGGDLIGFFPRGDRCRVAVADVTGKGIPAAILVGSLHQIIGQAVGRPLAAAMDQINDTVHRMTPVEVSVALILCSLEQSGRLTLHNAGCPFPLLYRAATSKVQMLGRPALPLGWFDHLSTSVHRLRLAPGDTLLLYTDGLSDAFFEGGRERVGESRIRKALRERGDQDIEALAEHLMDLARSPSQPDDVGVVLIRREVTCGLPMKPSE